MFAKQAWGIEIGSMSLKAARVALHDGKPQVVAWKIVEYRQAEDTDEARVLAVQNAVHDLVEEHKIRAGDLVAVSVPGRAVFSKFIKLPPVEKKRIPEIVRYESKQQIPFPIDDVVWDYQPVLEDPPAGEEVEVGIFAVRREIVQEKLALLAGFGIRPEIIQGGQLALYNYLNYDRKLEGAQIVVDMGAEASDLVIVGGPFWIRNLTTGGAAITKALQGRLQLSAKDAEKLKRESSASKQAEKLLAMMRPSMAAVLKEIQLSLGFYKSHHPDVRFSRLVVAGRGFLLKGLPEAIAKGLQLPVTPLGAPETLELAAGVDRNQFAQAVDRLGVPLGLALQALGLARIKLNLVPPEIVQAKRSAERKPFALAASLFVFISVLLFYLKVATVHQDAKACVAVVEQGKNTLAQHQGETEALRQGNKSYQKVRDVEQRLLQEIRTNQVTGFPHDAYLAILHATLAALPARTVWIQELTISIREYDAKEFFPPASGAVPAPPQQGKLIQVKMAATVNPATRPDGVVDEQETILQITKVISDKLDAIPFFDCSDEKHKLRRVKGLSSEEHEKIAKEGSYEERKAATGETGFPFALKWYVVPGVELK